MRLCPIPGVYVPCPRSQTYRFGGAHAGNADASAAGGAPSRRCRVEPYWTTILPGLKLLPGSIAANSPSIMCTPGAEMSCSSHGACSVPTA